MICENNNANNINNNNDNNNNNNNTIPYYTLRISDSMSRQPQVKAGCCSCATCSSLLAKAATLLVLTSPFMALKSRDSNIGDLPDLATSGCNSTAYSALHWWTLSQCWGPPSW